MGNPLKPVSGQGASGLWKYLTTNSVDRANEMNRNVCEFQTCSIRALFDTSMDVENAVVSGGDKKIRVNAIVAQARRSIENGIPVIILHEGNRILEKALESELSFTHKYKEVGTSSPCFEPFYHLKESEIINLTMESAPKEYDIKYNVRPYMEAISAYLHYKRKNLSFNMFSTCPHAQMFDKIDDLQVQGIISDSTCQELKAKLMQGQSECFKLEGFWSNFKMESAPILYHPKSCFKPTNVIDAISKREALCIDVMSASSKILMNTLFYQLKLALMHGERYTLILDSLPVNANEMYISYVKAVGSKASFLFAADDFLSMLGSDENLFSSILGEARTVVIMSHSSGKSAAKWAEYFGQYDKLEKSYGKTSGGSKRSPFSPFASPNYSSSVNIAKNRVYIVNPEEITRMGYGEAYIVSSNNNQLGHIYLSD